MTLESVRAYGMVPMRVDAGPAAASGGQAARSAAASMAPAYVAAPIPVYQRDGLAAPLPPMTPAVTFFPGVPANWSPGLWDELREVLRLLDERDRLQQQQPPLPPPAEPAPPAPPAEPAAPATPAAPEDPAPPAAPADAAPPAPPAPPAEAPEPPQAEGSYTVQSGDSLSAIAQRTLGDGNRWRELYDLNQDVIGPNPNLIQAGQVLRLPGGAQDPGPAPAPGPAAPEPPQAPGKLGNAPFISQYSPAGREHGYTNGGSNCGPTSMAMVARAIGYRQDLCDAKLINHLGDIGKTTANGTNVNGIAVMARTMGLSAETRGPGANVPWIVEQLRAGKMVVANGDYFAMKPHEDPAKSSGHYVLLAGIASDGRILVRDPADQRVRSVSEDELKHFISSNSNGGYQIVVG